MGNASLLCDLRSREVTENSPLKQKQSGRPFGPTRTARPPWDVRVVFADHPVRRYVSVRQRQTLWQFLPITKRVTGPPELPNFSRTSALQYTGRFESSTFRIKPIFRRIETPQGKDRAPMLASGALTDCQLAVRGATQYFEFHWHEPRCRRSSRR